MSVGPQPAVLQRKQRVAGSVFLSIDVDGQDVTFNTPPDSLYVGTAGTVTLTDAQGNDTEFNFTQGMHAVSPSVVKNNSGDTSGAAGIVAVWM